MASYYDDDDRDDRDDDEPAENYPAVYVDGTQIELDEPYNLDRVQVSFPDAENGYQTDAQAAAPLGWCNSAAITLDRGEDAVTLTISVGDPRGAFAITVRRLPVSHELVMEFPYPGETWLHRPLTLEREGRYRIG